MKIDRKRWILIVLMLAMIPGGVVYLLWPVLYPDVSLSAVLDPDCDLRAGPCKSTFPDGSSVTFSIEPRTIPVVKPLRLQVDVSGIEADSVEVDFKGVDMDMLYNRTKLTAEGGQRFVGKGIIPICIRQAMEWEGTVMIYTGKGLNTAPYRFITVASGSGIPGTN